jgi:hypothetical protein
MMTYNGVCIAEYGDGVGGVTNDCCLVHDSLEVFIFHRDKGSRDWMKKLTRPFKVDDPDDGVISVEVVIPKEYT